MEPKKENVFECSAVTKWLEIEITNYCRMHCIVCPRKQLSRFWFLSFDNFKELVSLLKEGKYTEVMVCGLWDAFLHKDINDFMEYLFQELPDIKLFFMTKGLSIWDEHFLKIQDLKNRWHNVSLTFSVFSLQKKIYNYLTGGDFFDTFMEALRKSHDMRLHYSLEFMLSSVTVWELDTFKKFAWDLGKDYGISLVHNWGGKISSEIHSRLFSEDMLKWSYVKRGNDDMCEVMKYDYLYIDCFWDVFQCSLNSLDRKGYLWRLWQYRLNEFLTKKNTLSYQDICKDCFYFRYKTFC